MLTRRDALIMGAAGLIVPATRRSRLPLSLQGIPTNPRSRTAEPSLNAPIVVKWRYSPGGTWCVSPTIVDGVAYGSIGDATVYAVDADSGDELWRVTTPSGPTRPVIDNGTAYVVTHGGELLALDAANGATRWQFADPTSSPVDVSAAQGTVLLVDQSGTVTAIDPATGTTIWQFVPTEPVTTMSNPVQIWNTSAFVCAGSGVMSGIDIDSGQERWRFETGADSPVQAFVEDDTVYLTSSAGLHAVHAFTGDSLWSSEVAGGWMNELVVADSVVYWSAKEGPFTAFDADDGTVLWQRPAEAWGVGGIGVTDSMVVFRVDLGGGVRNGYTFHGMDKATGSEVWRTEEAWNNPSHVTGDDGLLYIAEFHSKVPEDPFGVYAVESTTGQEVWRYEDIGGFGDAPTFANGTAFVGGMAGTVTAIGNLGPLDNPADYEIVYEPA